MLISAASNPMNQFTSKERDAETGLDYFLARYYSGAQARFLSPDEFKGGIVDPITGKDIGTNTALPYADITDPQTLNKYAYVMNNPLRYTDPNGHNAIAGVWGGAELGTFICGPVCTAAGAIVGGVIGAYVAYEAGKTIGGLISKSESKPETKATDGSAAPQKVPTQAPDFVGDAGGNVVPIPAGSTARPADNGNGVVYQPPVPAGAHPDADAVRVMGPHAYQPNGSITVHGPTGQPINPATGKPDTRAKTHTPIVPVAPKPCSSGGNGCSQ